VQAIDAVLHAPNPIYYASKLRRDWALRLSTGGGGYLTMLLFGKTGELEETGGRLYGRMKLYLRQERLEGSG
jgi:hypothetical protein